ncbi:MAG: OmpH family outer membrane protein, partial [Bacteroidota bacterium]
MRYAIGTAALVLFGALAAFGQMKIGYISSEAIMRQLPDAQDAQKQLDVLVVEWQNELNRMQQEWQRKFDEYDKRKLVMTDARLYSFRVGNGAEVARPPAEPHVVRTFESDEEPIGIYLQ